MKRICTVLLVLLSLCALEGRASSVAVVVSGTILDQDERPVSGAIVEAFYTNDASLAGFSLTAEDGSYRLDLRPGVYDFIVTPPEGSRSGSAFLQRKTITRDHVLDITLRTLPGLSLAGRLRNGERGPLADVTIALVAQGDTASLTTQTDAEGRFAMEAPPGDYRLTLAGTPQPGTRTAQRYTATTTIALDADTTLDLHLPFHPVTIRVQDVLGRGVAGVRMTTAVAHTPSSFTTGALAWEGTARYEASGGPLTDAMGETTLFLFPTAYDLTASPPDDLGLETETVSGVFVDGPLTQVLAFPEEIIPNTPPLADARSNHRIRVDQPLQLDGSGSTDADGDSLSYRWGFALPGPITGTARITEDHTIRPTFIAHTPGTYTVELIVNDGTTDSTPVVVLIAVSEKNKRSLFAQLGHTERSMHAWMKNQRWPVYLGVGAMAVGQGVYVRAQYANEDDLIHPAHSLFDFGFNLSAYVTTNRLTDYIGVSMLQNWMLQAFINTSLDYPVIWPEEPASYDLFGADIPKLFYGERRWAQLGLGITFLVAPRLKRLF